MPTPEPADTLYIPHESYMSIVNGVWVGESMFRRMKKSMEVGI